MKTQKFSAAFQMTLVAVLLFGMLFSAQAPVQAASAQTGSLPANAANPDPDQKVASIPMALTYFAAQRIGAAVSFEWSTVGGTGGIGFNLYGEREGQPTLINAEIIPANATASTKRQDYFYLAQVEGEIFYIEGVNELNEAQRFGPFKAGEVYGDRFESEPITLTETPTEAPRINAVTNNTVQNLVNIIVRESGMQRVTYEALRAAGYDLSALTPSKLQLVNRGTAVPIFMKAGSKFGAGSYFEFYGESLDTIYTDANVYTLQSVPTGAKRVSIVSGSPARGAVPPTSFSDTLTVDNNRAFAAFYALDDGWYDTSMLTYATPKSWSFPFDIPGLADTNAPATLELVVWGITDWPQDIDHHVVVTLNGVQVASEYFNGLTIKTIQIPVPAGALLKGANTLQLTLPGDTGVMWDMVNFDKFSLAYRRAYEARDGRLTFSEIGKAFKVTHLPTKNVSVYRSDEKGIVKLNTVQIATSGSTYTATFVGTGAAARYYVSAAENMVAPTFEPARGSVDLKRPAQFLIISHPDFINGIQPLAQARQAQGFTVSVVDAKDIYAQYSFGVFDPQAIKQYIAYAKENLGAQYVLLVGGDTYDYHNYLGKNIISYIPSLYGQTSPTVRMVPVDPLYADVNGDNIPDLALGRFPVRSTAELDMMVAKTLAYQNKSYGRTAVFASDYSIGVDFRNASMAMASSLPAGWTSEQVSLDYYEPYEAQPLLVAAMNRGTALVTYYGHSTTTLWSYSNLFNTTSARNLTNAGKPFVVVQWGCWNSYYIEPSNNYMVQALLFSGDKGAAALFGATTLTYSNSQTLLSNMLTPLLATPGMTIGQAALEAKIQLAQYHPEYLDVLLGWTLMGDPTLAVEP